jgi:hypothetical protein
MPKIPSLHPTLQGWLLDGPLAAYVPAYVERLERGRYASSTSQRCLNAVCALRSLDVAVPVAGGQARREPHRSVSPGAPAALWLREGR